MSKELPVDGRATGITGCKSILNPNKMNRYHILLSILTILLISCNKPTTCDLSGQWFYRLDEKEIGGQEQWYAQKLNESTIELPASLRDHNIGRLPTLTTKWTGSIYDSSWFFRPERAKYRKEDSLKFPFWLTPIKRYVGKAWYQKEVAISKSWEGKDLQLFLERPHWQTKVWFDSTLIGARNSLSTPHKFVIPSTKVSRGKHLITICVDNAIREIDPGINSHSITDHTQGNWNGIVGRVELQAINHIHIERIKTTPDIESHTVKVEIYLMGAGKAKEQTLTIKVKGINHNDEPDAQTQQHEIVNGKISAIYDMGEQYRAWSEFDPNLYQLEVTLNNLNERKITTFGMREFTVNQQHFEINGIPVFLRGTTECSVFPLTGYPPTDTASWSRIFNICKSFGLNHMRFHSYCPPEAAFTMADKAGVYLQVEGPSWAKYSVTLGDGKPIDAYLMDETKRIIDEYGNHPSFVMMAYGNEPSGHYVHYLENWVEHFREYDPQRVFTGASTGRSWAIINNSDFIVRSPPRGLEWKDRQPECIFDYRDKTENQNRPYVTFEMGQWCAFPNFKEIDKYTGVLKALNFELFKENLVDNRMGEQAHDFLMASGKLQALCYKQEIEATLRTPNLAGFQLLALNDFSGQGTALVGVLDAFWDEKGYIGSKEFKAFCNEVVPLVRLPKYTFTNNEVLEATVEVSNFSGAAINAVPCVWSLKNSKNEEVASAVLNGDGSPIPIGHCNNLGKISCSLEEIKQAEKLSLEVMVGEYKNAWDVWVYPQKVHLEDNNQVYVTRNADKKAMQVLDSGGKVLLLASGEIEHGKDVVQYFTPVFWNTSWFRMRPPHTTGLLIDDSHPVFNHFPTDYYSNFQWWELANRQQVMNLENFPNKFKAIVQPIDTWFINRKLAMLFEANVGNGKIMVCSINLDNEVSGAVARQFSYSLMEYMNSVAFNPKQEVEWGNIKELFEEKERKSWESFVKAKP